MDKPQIICDKCGAYNDIDEIKCWKCKNPIPVDKINAAKEKFISSLSEEERNEYQTIKLGSQEESMNNNEQNDITIVDIRMPFWSMVVFMVKAAIASIPAFIILAIIGVILSAVLGGVFGRLSLF